MNKALKIIFASYRYCLIRILEFRSEVISWSILSTLWALIALSIVYAIFGQVESIAGWTKNEVLALSLVGSMFNSFLWWWIYPSVLHFTETIRTGQFDFYLTKPVNPRFLISISRFEFDNYARVFVTLGLLIYLCVSQSLPVSILSTIYCILLFFIGIFIYYCLFFMIATLCFWLTQIEELEQLFDTMATSGRYPTTIFHGGLRAIFFYVIPMAFVATFPVSVLLHKSGGELVVVGFVVATIFFLISQLFWNFALRHYSSASS